MSDEERAALVERVLERSVDEHIAAVRAGIGLDETRAVSDRTRHIVRNQLRRTVEIVVDAFLEVR